MPHTWILNLRIFIIPIVLYLLYVLKEYRVRVPVWPGGLGPRFERNHSDGHGTTRKTERTEKTSATTKRSSKETRDRSSTCFISMLVTDISSQNQVTNVDHRWPGTHKRLNTVLARVNSRSSGYGSLGCMDTLQVNNHLSRSVSVNTGKLATDDGDWGWPFLTNAPNRELFLVTNLILSFKISVSWNYEF